MRDGRKNGYFNVNLVPPLERERSSKVSFNESFKKKASIDAYIRMAKDRENGSLTQNSVEISDISELRTSRLGKKSLGPSGECPSFL